MRGEHSLSASLRRLVGLGAIGLAGCSSPDSTPFETANGAAGGSGSAAAAGTNASGTSGSAAISGGMGGMPAFAGSGETSPDTAGAFIGSAGTTPSGGDSSTGGVGGSAAGQGGTGGTAPSTNGSGGAAAAGGGTAGARINLALNQPATASSIEQGDHAAIRINDGDVTTRWVGVMAVYPQWNQIDLGAPHRVDTVLVWPYMMRAYQFVLEGSLDGATYFTLSDQSANTISGDTIPVTFPARSTRYVRITISGAANYDKGWSAINELQIFEAP